MKGLTHVQRWVLRICEKWSYLGQQRPKICTRLCPNHCFTPTGDAWSSIAGPKGAPQRTQPKGSMPQAFFLLLGGKG